MMDLGILVIRLMVGLTIAAHGSQKLFGWWGGPGVEGFHGWLSGMNLKPARLWTYVAALAEFAGGLGVALGVLTPIAAMAVLGAMLTAVLTVHLAKGFFNQNGGFEFPAVVGATMIGLALTGPGTFSVDQLLRVNLPEPATFVVALVLAVLGVLVAVESRQLGVPGARRQPTA
jgi:putative oxidoreductase